MINKNFFKFSFGFTFLILIGISAILVGKNLDQSSIEAIKAAIIGMFR